MLNDRKGREDSFAVNVFGEKTLNYWAEPSEDLESEEASTEPLWMRSVMRRWGLCLGGGPSRVSTVAWVWGEGSGARYLGGAGPAW